METSQRNVMTRLAVETKLLKEVGEKDRNKLQEVLTEMLQDIQIACDKEQLQVALGYGSVIGAVRHGGFIPWDDDIDLIMLREDWERFKLVFDDVLGDKYILEAPNYGNKDTKCTWGKIYKRNTELVEIIRENFDLRPAGIIRMLDLRRPIYKQTAAYGHFGRTDVDLPWEKLDKVEDLKKYL